MTVFMTWRFSQGTLNHKYLLINELTDIAATDIKARAGELTEVAVRKLLGDVLESVGQKPLATETPHSFFTSWLAGKGISTKPGVYRLYNMVSARFLEFLGDKAAKSLASVTPGYIAAYRDARLSGDGASVDMLLLDLRIIRSVFSLARRQGLIPHSPAEAVELPPNKPIERDVFASEEIQALFERSQPGMADTDFARVLYRCPAR